MLLSDIDPKLYSAMQKATFDTFACRLSPDEWEISEEDFRQNLQSSVKDIASQQAVEDGQAGIEPGCDCNNPDECML